MQTECDVCGDAINGEDGARLSIVFADAAHSYMLCDDCAGSLVETITEGITEDDSEAMGR